MSNTEILEGGEIVLALDPNAVNGVPITPTVIIYRPGVASSAPYYNTWAEVAAAIARMTTPFTLYLDPSGGGSMVADASVNARNLGAIDTVPKIDIASYVTLTVNDGVTLSNFREIGGTAQILGLCATTPALAFDSGVNLYEFASLVSDAGAAVPMCEVQDGTYVWVLGPGVSIFPNGSQPVFHIASSLTLNVYAIQTGFGFTNGSIAGPGNVNYLVDGTFFAPIPGPIGTVSMTQQSVNRATHTRGSLTSGSDPATINDTDVFVAGLVGALTIPFPTSPYLGQEFGVKIKDSSVTNTNTLTLNGNGKTLEDPTSAGVYVSTKALNATTGTAGHYWKWRYFGTWDLVTKI